MSEVTISLDELASITGPGELAEDDVFHLIDTSDGADKKIPASLLGAELIKIFASSGGAGLHNSIYRGKYLGTSVPDADWEAIDDGTFDDLWIGDYYTIGSVNYRYAGFNYWLHCGDTECKDNHALMVPDSCLYNGQMNTSNITTGAYVGSAMYTSGLDSAKNTITAAFGSAHILNHREHLQNAVTNGYASGGTWYDSTVELMNELMVYGSLIFTPGNSLGATVPNIYTIDKSQLPLFRLDPSKICNRASWWLRDVGGAAYFAYVSSTGVATANNASYSYGVRPAFGIC